jgi:hypothetical protein
LRVQRIYWGRLHRARVKSCLRSSRDDAHQENRLLKSKFFHTTVDNAGAKCDDSRL